MSWQGIRVTFGCGHMELRDRPRPGSDEDKRWVVGSLGACWVCPLRGAGHAAVRQVVRIESVAEARRPEPLKPEHWH